MKQHPVLARLFSIMLCVIMLTGCVPASVWAAEYCDNCRQLADVYCADCLLCGECVPLTECTNCESFYCDDCRIGCSECGGCESCTDLCDTCNKCLYCCDTCVDGCPECGREPDGVYCADCLLCTGCEPIRVCPVCDEGFCETCRYFCPVCGVCQNCAALCNGCDLCPDCADGSCFQCGDPTDTPPTDPATCPDCGVLPELCCADCGLCGDCAEIYECTLCGEYYCSDCRIGCAECGACFNCADPCPLCGDYCSNCRNTCTDCGACELCVTLCDGCGWYCADCSGDQCPNCEHVFTDDVKLLPTITIDGLDRPTAGQAPDTNITVSNPELYGPDASYGFGGVHWYDPDGALLTPEDTFEAGVTYRAEIKLTVVTLDGVLFVKFDSNPAVTLNGKAVDTDNVMVGNSGTTAYVYADYLCYGDVTKAELTDLAAPEAGKAPVFTIAWSNPELYSVDTSYGFGGMFWYDPDGAPVTPEDTFEAGKTYQVEIKLVSATEDGVVLTRFADELSATINGFDIDADGISVAGDGRTAYICAYYECESAARKGDLNGDDKVNITDAVLLYYHVNGKTLLADATGADMNGDNKITIQDAVTLYYFVNGKADTL